MKRIVVLLAVLALTSCESSVQINVRLKGPSDAEAETCALVLARASDGFEVANVQRLGKEFNELIPISPLPKDYSVSIKCEGYREFRSASFKMPPRLLFSELEDRLIDLNTVALERDR